MLREFRPSDTPELLALMRSEFPQEEALLGTRPEGFARVVRRVFRVDTRLLLGLLRLLGRPLFRFFVIESEGRIVATTLLTFAARSGYVSMVVVDPTHRRRGLARRLLEAARAATVRRGRSFIALDVLESNDRARTLYGSSGYQPLRTAAYLVHDDLAAFRNPPPTPEGLRPFRRSDAVRLAEIVRAGLPGKLADVMPVRPRDLSGAGWVNRILASDSSFWVIDRGAGPLAFVAATVSPATEAAQLTAPIIDPALDPESAAALVRTAGHWVAARGAPRLVTTVPAENPRGRRALEDVGFRPALSLLTLYRPSA